MTSKRPAQQELPDKERIIPPHAPGMRIGLFGGTFDPPHRAHVDACLLAMKRLQLDRIWWLVTPGNPLKNTHGLAPLESRINAARAITHHPRIDVTGLEAVINTRFTFDTIDWLLTRCPGVRFVWIMGADNLRHFHRWQKWRAIAEIIPIVVVDRPGPSLYASNSTAGQALARFRIAETDAASLPARRAPAWTFLHGLKSSLSSTALRALRGAPKKPATPATVIAEAPAPKTSTRKAAGKKKSSTKAGKKASPAKKTKAAGTSKIVSNSKAGKTTKAAGLSKTSKPNDSRRKTGKSPHTRRQVAGRKRRT